MPLEIISLPPHFLSATFTREPARSRKRVAAIAAEGVLKVLKVSWKRTTSPLNSFPSNEWLRNQSTNVCLANEGRGRLRSIPAKRSRSHRLGREFAIQFERGARREPQRFNFSILPKSRLRRGRPFVR